MRRRSLCSRPLIVIGACGLALLFGSTMQPDGLTVPAVSTPDPSFRLPEPRTFDVEYRGDESLTADSKTGLLLPRALASADFDEDGVPDLACGYAVPNGGVVIVHRGNVDAIYPHGPEAQQRRLKGNFTDSPFLAAARIFELPEPPDFLGAGDFDNDGHRDVVAAAHGDDGVYLVPGDGNGGLGPARRVSVPGDVTALVAGEINHPDGLADLVVGVLAGQRASLLVFEGPDGALRGEPEVLALPATATDLVLGRLDDDPPIDLGVAVGRELLIVHGRDRLLSLDEVSRAQVGPPSTDRITLPATIHAVAVGDFVWESSHRPELALLLDDGALQVLGRDVAPKEPPGAKRTEASSERAATRRAVSEPRAWIKVLERHVSAPAPAPPGSAPATGRPLLAARVSGLPMDDLVVLDAASPRLRLFMGEAGEEQAGVSATVDPVSADLRSAPVAVLPMRLNGDALSDLVILGDGFARPAVMTSAARATFTVDSTGDEEDASPGDGNCDTGSTACTLRAAIQEANASAGPDVIQFSIGTGAQTLVPGSGLPTVTEAVTIDGTTQPGFAGEPIIELDAGSTGGIGLYITAGSSAVRGLVINRAAYTGIGLDTGGGNVIEGNFIGTDVAGAAALGNVFGVQIRDASSNTVGGTTAAARNVISGNTAQGVLVRSVGSPPSQTAGNLVQGNYIGTDATGAASLGNDSSGVEIQDAPSNTVGGTTAGAGNVVSGNVNGIRINSFASPSAETTLNLVQGNYIGTDAGGTVDLGNVFDGVEIEDAVSNTVGGTAAAARNVISGNGQDGVNLHSLDFVPAETTLNLIQGNYIGVDVTGNAALGNDKYGIHIYDASSSTVGGTTTAARNIISGNGVAGGVGGVAISSHLSPAAETTLNLVQGNYIGIDANGTAALGNAGAGVEIEDASSNTVGGSVAGAGNVISGNDGFGVAVFAWDSSPGDTTQNLVQGNLIGTDANGTAALGNTSYGVVIADAASNTVGGTTAEARNVISGNGSHGVAIFSMNSPPAQTTLNLVQGNYIGTDATGTAALGNAVKGIVIEDAAGNTIGGATAGAGNVISNNDADGVSISSQNSPPAETTQNLVQGNLIGTDATGTVAMGNDESGVSIYDAASHAVGGTTAAARNVVSANGIGGVSIWTDATPPAQTTLNVVQGNYIGTDASGSARLGNSWFGAGINDAVGNTIGGTAAGAGNVISGNESSGVNIGADLSVPQDTTLNVVQGNYIGTDATGRAALRNVGVGVEIHDASSNTVGGTTAGARNIISGNRAAGVRIYSFSFPDAQTTLNLVQGNYIGTDVTGTAAVGNVGEGVVVDESPSNTIGGTTVGAGNVISGNEGAGVVIQDATLNLVQGNYIGTDAGGAAGLGNLAGAVLAEAVGNTIGGTTAGAGNVISSNSAGGVIVFESTGTANGNRILRNSIVSNTGLGIDLGFDGVTPNDPGDVDGSPNNLQNFPVLTSVTIGATDTTVSGWLDSAAQETFRIDFYTNTECDASGHGEGAEYLGFTNAPTDPGGLATFSESFPNTDPPGTFVTATATDPAGNTSELSACSPIPPRVILVSPADDAWGVPVSTNVTLVFSEALDPLEVTSATVIVADSDGVQVTGELALISDGTTATLDPGGTLTTGTTYTVTVTDGVKDLAGTGAIPFKSRFRTVDTAGSGVILPDNSVQGVLPASPPPPPGRAPASAESRGTPTGDNLGISTAKAGDLNGDTIPDVLGGAPGYPAYGDTEAGGVGVFLGSTDDTARRSPDIIYMGEAPYDRAGVSVAGDFDFNGDGVPDILIGAERVGGRGKVYLIYFDPLDYPNLGTPAVIDFIDLGRVGDTALPGKDIDGVVFEGESNDDRAGFALAAGSDLNGDALGDVVIGAPGANGADGKVYLVASSLAPPLGELSLSDVGTAIPGVIHVGAAGQDEQRGHSVAMPGDVTGDATDDLVMGAPLADTSGLDTGKVLVVSGSDPATIAAEIHGNQAHEQLGFSVAGGGDNRAFPPGASGGADLLIGAPYFDTATFSNAGRVVQTSGRLPAGTIDVARVGSDQHGTPVDGVIWHGPQADGHLGWSVGLVGDLTGDTLDEIGLGAPMAKNEPSQDRVGAVYVIAGRAVQVGASPDLGGEIDLGQLAVGVWGETFFGRRVEERVGTAVAAAGDMDGNPVNAEEFSAGAPGWDHCTAGDLEECNNDVDCGSGTCGIDAGAVHLGDILGGCTREGCTIVDLDTGAELVVPPDSLAEGERVDLAAEGDMEALGLQIDCTSTSLYGQTLVAVSAYTRRDGCEQPPCLPPGFEIGPDVELSTLADREWQLTYGEELDLRYCEPGFGWIPFSGPGLPTKGTVKSNDYLPDRLTVAATGVDTLRLYGAFVDDGDSDVARSECDCAPGNVTLWAPPGAVSTLRLARSGETVALDWDPPAFAGGSPGTQSYDTIRSGSASDFVTAAVCVESDEPDTHADDTAAVGPGEILYYMVRAENDCPTDPGCFDPGLRAARDCS